MKFDRQEYDYGALWSMTLTDEEFAESARQPDEWINAARPLRVGAYVLKEASVDAAVARAKGAEAIRSNGLLFTSVFLASLSLENVLKAVLLVRRPEIVANGTLPFGGWGHDLLRIASEAGFQLEQQEAEFVRVSCNECTRSFGRYRIPMRKTNAPGVWHFHSGAFRFFESVFMRAVQTALLEACNRPNENRVAQFQELLRDIRNDVPSSSVG